LTHDKKDGDNSNLLGYVQTISIKASDSVCFTTQPQSYSVYSYEPRKLVDLYVSSHSKISYSTELFVCRVHNFHVEIIKQIQASNEQYKFRVGLHKYHDVLNVDNYSVIHISIERCPLETNHKFQVSSATLFKVLQMIKSNSYIIKLPLDFDINSTFDMKDFVIYKIQFISNAPFETHIPLSLYFPQKNILMLLWMLKLFLLHIMNFSES